MNSKYSNFFGGNDLMPNVAVINICKKETPNMICPKRVKGNLIGEFEPKGCFILYRIGSQYKMRIWSQPFKGDSNDWSNNGPDLQTFYGTAVSPGEDIKAEKFIFMGNISPEDDENQPTTVNKIMNLMNEKNVNPENYIIIPAGTNDLDLNNLKDSILPHRVGNKYCKSETEYGGPNIFRENGDQYGGRKKKLSRRRKIKRKNRKSKIRFK